MPSLYGKKRPAKPRRKMPACADLSRELLAAEAAALGKNPARKWHPCKTGEHKLHCGCKDEQ